MEIFADNDKNQKSPCRALRKYLHENTMSV